MATPLRWYAGDSEGTRLHRAVRTFLLKGHTCLGLALVGPRRGQLWTFFSKGEVGLKHPVSGPKVLGDTGGVIFLAEGGDGTSHQRSLGSYC